MSRSSNTSRGAGGPSSSSYRPSGDDNNADDYKTTFLLIKLTNLSLFGLGLVLFVIGVLYLTIYRYEYSFTIFSIDLMAGIYVAVGALLGIVSIIGIMTMSPLGKPVIAIFIGLVVAVCLIVLFVLGVIGLSLNGNGELLTQNRNNMFYTAREYNELLPYLHSTKKINWLQTKFLCCGIDTYADWKSIVTFRGPNYFLRAGMPNDQQVNLQYINQNQYQQNYPYIDDVPDSCCVNIAASCGKQAYSYGRDKGTLINIRGCLSEYNRWFSKDMIFLCAMAVSVSIILLVLALVLVYLYGAIRKNQEYVIRSYDQQERRKFVR